MLSRKVCEYLRWLKESGDFTQQQLSDLTGVPMGTIPKYFSGMDDESASFETVRKLVMVMGGSLDALAGIRSDPAPDPTGDRSAVIAGLEAHLQEKEAHLSDKRRWMDEDHEHVRSVILYERRRARIACAVSYAALGLFAILFVLDFLIPSIGWIQR